MRYDSNRLRSFAACGLAAAALLACGGTVQAQQRPGGIGGQGGGGSSGVGNNGNGTSALSGGTGLAGNSSPSFSGNGGMAGSFGGSAFGGGNSTFGGASTVNPFYSTYGNPLQGGIGTGPNTAFGTPMYGNLNATSTNLLGGQGTAGSRGGSASGSGGMGAGSWPGPLYGALGIVPAARQQPVPPARVTPGPGSGGTASNPAALSPVMQADFQDLVNRSDGLSPATRNGVKFGIDGVTVVLRGAAANEVEARLLESLIHYAPGVREVRNEMTWRSP